MIVMVHAAEAVQSDLSEAPVLDVDGRAVPLSSLWRDRPIVLAFVRHFG
ncbi:MAG TPA: hypothetical protein VF765_05775 [Polyangiaceae bacterium]